MTGVLLPIALYRTLSGTGENRWRRYARGWPLAGLVIALALQYALAISAGGPRRYGSRDLLEIPLIYGFRVAGSAVLGEVWSRSAFVRDGRTFAVLMLILVAALFALAVTFADRHRRRLLAVLVGYSAIFLLASLGVRGGAAAYLAEPPTLPGSRYTILPLYLLYCGAVVAVGLVGRRDDDGVPEPTVPGGRGGRWQLQRIARVALPVVAGLVLLGQLVGDWAPKGPRTSGTSWHLAVEDARLACARGVVGQHVVGHLLLGREPYVVTRGIVGIPVSPFTQNWVLRLRCDELS